MKPTALLVNTSRAELIAPGALVEALEAGRPGFAAVDVYEQEPVRGHPLLRLPNALCTPHLGFVAREPMDAYFADQFERVLAFERGAPVDVINPEVLRRA
jgi:D-3-phosphoglycerate dehydrogenase